MIHKGKTGAPRVLVVDDEVAILESVVDLLRRDYDVYATDTAEEAFSLLEKEDIALILSDQRMPSMLGYELLTRATRISPDTVRILFTGYSDIEAVIHAVNEGRIYHFLSKPWEPEHLQELVSAATQKFSLMSENRRLVQELARMTEITNRDQQEPAGDVRRQERLEDENQSLRNSLDSLNKSFWHLQKLRDLLPTCLTCGKVEVAPGKWQNLLDFFKENSLFLTHTYCPACAREFMKDMDDEPKTP